MVYILYYALTNKYLPSYNKGNLYTYSYFSKKELKDLDDYTLENMWKYFANLGKNPGEENEGSNNARLCCALEVQTVQERSKECACKCAPRNAHHLCDEQALVIYLFDGDQCADHDEDHDGEDGERFLDLFGSFREILGEKHAQYDRDAQDDEHGLENLAERYFKLWDSQSIGKGGILKIKVAPRPEVERRHQDGEGCADRCQ